MVNEIFVDNFYFSKPIQETQNIVEQKSNSTISKETNASHRIRYSRMMSYFRFIFEFTIVTPMQNTVINFDENFQ